MPAITAETQRRRPFAPGESGNPAGRLKGARNQAAILAETLLKQKVEAMVQKLVDRALEGNVAALRVCLDRAAPIYRDRAAFDLPEIHCLSDAVDASAVLLTAVAAGEIAPREAERVSALIIYRGSEGRSRYGGYPVL